MITEPLMMAGGQILLLLFALVTPSSVVASSSASGLTELFTHTERQTPPGTPDPQDPTTTVRGYASHGAAVVDAFSANPSGHGPPASLATNPEATATRTSAANVSNGAARVGASNRPAGWNSRRASAQAATANAARLARERQATRSLDSYTFDRQFETDPNYPSRRAFYDFTNPDTIADLYNLANQATPTLTPINQPNTNQTPPPEITQTIWNWTHRTPVATPKPFVQAGRGIPGILTYLQTGMNLNINETVPSPAGPLQINGTATLTIDWGDGEVQTGITNPGGPYPQGQLTHHYPNTGQYTITITANWLINYNLNGTTGTIPITTTGTLPNFPVTALRAVARPV